MSDRVRYLGVKFQNPMVDCQKISTRAQLIGTLIWSCGFCNQQGLFMCFKFYNDVRQSNVLKSLKGQQIIRLNDKKALDFLKLSTWRYNVPQIKDDPHTNYVNTKKNIQIVMLREFGFKSLLQPSYYQIHISQTSAGLRLQQHFRKNQLDQLAKHRQEKLKTCWQFKGKFLLIDLMPAPPKNEKQRHYVIGSPPNFNKTTFFRQHGYQWSYHPSGWQDLYKGQQIIFFDGWNINAKLPTPSEFERLTNDGAKIPRRNQAGGQITLSKVNIVILTNLQDWLSVWNGLPDIKLVRSQMQARFNVLWLPKFGIQSKNDVKKSDYEAEWG